MLECAVISFCYNQTDPSGGRAQVAIAEVRDDKEWVRFQWLRPLGNLGVDAATIQMFPPYPHALRKQIEEEGLQATIAQQGRQALYVSNTFPVEQDGPVAIFGDVHGDHGKLLKLIKKIQEKHGDIPMYTAGDLIDRGPHSRSVIDTCIKHNIRGVMGNHDQWLHQYISGFGFDTMALHDVMGGKATIRSYGLEDFSLRAIENELYKHIPNSHFDWVYNMLPYMKIVVAGHTYWLAHAGLGHSDTQPFWEKAHGDEDSMMAHLCRSNPAALQWGHIQKLPEGVFEFPSGSTVVMGHRVRWRGADVEDHVICLDTGCGFPKGRLTAIVLPQGELISV